MQSVMSTGAGDDEQFLPARRVWERYGVTDMTLWRWIHDDKLNFPPPVYIRRFRYWRLSDLVAWERSRLHQGRAVIHDNRSHSRRKAIA